MINDLEQYDKLKIETIVRQRREASRGGVNHDHHKFYTSLNGMIKAFFRDGNEHEYEDVAGFSQVLCQRLMATVGKEADMINKDATYISLYTLLANYILNDVCNNIVVKDGEYDDYIVYDGYFICTIDRNTTDSDITGLSYFVLNKYMPEGYEDKTLFELINKLHEIILKWMSLYKEVEIKDGKVFIEPKEYISYHLKRKLYDMFVTPKECNIEAYKIETVR
jgi:hypothetical protein